MATPLESDFVFWNDGFPLNTALKSGSEELLDFSDWSDGFPLAEYVDVTASSPEISICGYGFTAG